MARSTNNNKESNIVSFFQTAPIAVANTVFGIVRGTMKNRNTPAAPAAPKKKVTRRPRAKKVAAEAMPLAAAAAVVAEPVVS